METSLVQPPRQVYVEMTSRAHFHGKVILRSQMLRIVSAFSWEKRCARVRVQEPAVPPLRAGCRACRGSRVKASLCVVVPSTTVGPDNDQANPKWAPHNHNYALLNQDHGLGETPHGTVYGKRGEGNLPEEAFDKIFT